MLLTVGHDHNQLDRIGPDELAPTVKRATVQNGQNPSVIIPWITGHGPYCHIWSASHPAGPAPGLSMDTSPKVRAVRAASGWFPLRREARGSDGLQSGQRGRRGSEGSAPGFDVSCAASRPVGLRRPQVVSAVRMAETSNSRVTISLTSTPPASSAAFQLTPQSLRFTLAVPSRPIRWLP